MGFGQLSGAKCIDLRPASKRRRENGPKTNPSLTQLLSSPEQSVCSISYKAGGEWDAEVIDKDAIIVVLSMDLKPAKINIQKYILTNCDSLRYQIDAS